MKRGEGKFDRIVRAIAETDGRGVFVTKIEKGSANYIADRVWKEHQVRIKIIPSRLKDEPGYLFEKANLTLYEPQAPRGAA